MTNSLLAAMLSALIAAVIVVVAVVLRRYGRPAGSARALRQRDIVAAWPPQATALLTPAELAASALLREAMPDHLVFAQVSLSRFIRVSRRNSYGEWLQRVGTLSADLLLCDDQSRVMAVVDIISDGDSEGSRQRHERMTRVLRTAGLPVLVWNAAKLPHIDQVREQLLLVVTTTVSSALPPPPSSPMPLTPGDESFAGPQTRPTGVEQAPQRQQA
jgi:hypothetical protein